MVDAAAIVGLATAADALAMAALHAESLPPGWSRSAIAASCAMANRLVLKISLKNEVLGFTILQFAADEAEILTIAVKRSFRRKGLGRLLLGAAVNAARERKALVIYLEVAEGNLPARRLYETFSFSLFGRRANYYTSGRAGAETALIMRCSLDLLGTGV